MSVTTSNEDFETTLSRFQVGSSTWAEQLLKLKGVPIGPTTQIHKLAEQLFPVIENKVGC